MKGHFGPARVRSVTPLAEDVRLIEIEPEGGAEPYPTGSHLDLSVTRELAVRRNGQYRFVALAH